MSDIMVGEALPWDVFGESGSLLVRQGHVVASFSQADLLVERGFIADSSQSAPPVYQEPPSVLRLLNQANHALAEALAAIAAGQPGAADALAGIAALVADALDLDQEVALASILLNQQACLYPVRHSVDTAVVALTVGRALKMEPAALLTLALGALSMNVGMLEQHERLRNSTAPLSPADRAYIRAHPEAGVALLRQCGVDDEAWLACVLDHHENDDGSGYPSGKNPDQVSQAGKIIALADRYCARVCARQYKAAMLPNAALRDILMEGQRTVDTALATMFIRELGIYPIGTFVRMINGEIGVVTGKGLNSTTPYVHSLVGPRGAPLEVALRRDTKSDLHTIREVLSQQQAGVTVRMQQLWGAVARE